MNSQPAEKRMPEIKPAPVRKSIEVRAEPARAFEAFTARMGRWWIRGYSINRDSAIADVIIEPKVGGRWYERGQDGSECEWGKVLAWEPPGRVVLAWQIEAGASADQWQYNPALITELEVRFVAAGAGVTRVELEHRNLERLGAHAARMREIFESPMGWGGLLDAFAREAGG
jgi:uncharacterized protein YndB with AHSA1/START domain